MKDGDLGSPIRIERSSNAERIVFSVRLPDEVAALIRSDGERSTLRLKLDQMNPLNNELIIKGFNSFPLNRVPETQVVNVLRLNPTKDTMNNLGILKEKLLIKQELEETKKAQIRQDSADAERVRTARKTVTIDDHLAPSSSRKRRANSASTQNTPVKRIFKSLSGEKFGGEARVQAAWTGKARARPAGTMILPRSQQLNHRSNGSQSERDSQHSWSPVPTEHAVSPLDGFFERPSKASSISEKIRSISVERKASATELIAGRLPTTGDRGSPAYHQLAEEFGRRYGEYLALNEWADRRLEVFRQLQKDLCSPDDPSIQQQVIFRLVVEDQRLKNDREYQEKLEKLEECCASLMMIKARLRTAKSSQSG